MSAEYPGIPRATASLLGEVLGSAFLMSVGLPVLTLFALVPLSLALPEALPFYGIALVLSTAYLVAHSLGSEEDAPEPDFDDVDVPDVIWSFVLIFAFFAIPFSVPVLVAAVAGLMLAPTSGAAAVAVAGVLVPADLYATDRFEVSLYLLCVWVVWSGSRTASFLFGISPSTIDSLGQRAEHPTRYRSSLR